MQNDNGILACNPSNQKAEAGKWQTEAKEQTKAKKKKKKAEETLD